MAKAEIKMPYIEPHSTYFICTIMYRVKSGYSVLDNSLRIYYSTDPDIESGTPYVPINNTSGAILDRKIVNGWKVVVCRVPAEGTALTPDTPYWLRSWLQLYKSDGTKYKKYRGPKIPTPAITEADPVKTTLFRIASYSNPHEDDDGEIMYDQIWEDFTDCVVVPTYDVNYEDVNEDWEDANYVTHRIVPRSKITGSLELRFAEKRRYNLFLKLIKQNRQVNGTGYTYLQVQVNNDLDLDSGESGVLDNLATKKSVRYNGMFFIKMENNPHIPDTLYGHFDQYESLRLEITEA